MSELPNENLNSSADIAALRLLWANMVMGDKDSFEKVYHLTFSKLHRYGCKISTEEIVEEVIQELFISLWHKRESLPKVAVPLAYLFRSFRNRLLNHMSKTKKGHFIPLEHITDFSYPLNDETQQIQQREMLQQAINKLSHQQREVIYLLYFNELSASEVAEILSLKIRTVYNTAHQAIQVLRKHLHKDAFVFYLLPVSILLLYLL